MSQWVHHNRGNIGIKSDVDTCTACELCYDRLPEIFVNRGDGIPLVMIKVPIEQVYDKLLQTAEDCPSGSIILY